MLLYLIRHGETTWNSGGRAQGRSDVPLNARGVAQAEALAAALATAPLTAVYASPLARARETAAQIAVPHGLAVQVVERLIEMDYGEFEAQEIRNLPPAQRALLTQWREQPGSFRMPGGESLSEVQDRAWAWIEAARERHANEVIAAVAHNMVNLALLCRALSLPLNDMRRLRQDLAAINVLELGGPSPVVVRMNGSATGPL